MTIHPGALVSRKGGDGTQMLVTRMTAAFTAPADIGAPVAVCQWLTADGDMAFADIPVADLVIEVADKDRVAHANAKAKAKEEATKIALAKANSDLHAAEAARQKAADEARGKPE